MHHIDANKNAYSKGYMGTTQECYELSWHKSWKQYSTKQKLYGHLTPISQVRRLRHAGHC